MRVIDGMHRLRAARIRGDQTIQVRYFDGSAADAFVLAVRSNVRHGLPLSQADRTAAAERIIVTHRQWSDRAIASAAGLSPKTVASIRRRSTGEGPHLNARLGRDGRMRPVDASEGRREASRLITEHPDLPLREVARRCGISLGTAHDVRERLRLGQGPVPERGRGDSRSDRGTAALDEETGRGVTVLLADCGSGRGPDRDPEALLRLLRKDPSLRFTETGRALLRLFDVHARVSGSREELISGVPAHCAELIVDLADDCARAWHQFAEELRTRRQESA
ncbi:ParB N-terminal domain-containing protein [Streptomyces sp. TP-A0356]|uniref:ParB N-terminal domain-containing protein n=1 Tax=Streptomyces sp. TP-A0356 TaxID=1359208 RepID=UPI0006E43CCA|nr:ParB N-terminal domain-containing protein [Streptomyces sp. TP-A0356]